jgi:pSer/pThr/pTyr-binding forkhead associated (FHA) protein
MKSSTASQSITPEEMTFIGTNAGEHPGLDFDGLFARLKEISLVLQYLPAIPQSPTLIVLGKQPNEPQAVCPLAEIFTVGRGRACDFRTEHSKMSRQHFQLTRDGEDYVVTDLQSSNGTRIAGRPVKIRQHRLTDGDVIMAGGQRFLFVRGGSAVD